MLLSLDGQDVPNCLRPQLEGVLVVRGKLQNALSARIRVVGSKRVDSATRGDDQALPELFIQPLQPQQVSICC
jgi:hypothetical protein